MLHERRVVLVALRHDQHAADLLAVEAGVAGLELALEIALLSGAEVLAACLGDAQGRLADLAAAHVAGFGRLGQARAVDLVDVVVAVTAVRGDQNVGDFLGASLGLVKIDLDRLELIQGCVEAGFLLLGEAIRLGECGDFSLEGVEAPSQLDELVHVDLRGVA